MRIIGTVKVKSLANSRTGCKLTKPLDQYLFKALEESRGDYLCVVMDDGAAIGMADIDKDDVEKFYENPKPRDFLEALADLMFTATEAPDGYRD